MKIYIDIDGVLLGRNSQTQQPKLANHAEKFLRYCLYNFDCYWLTTHCKGSIDTVLTYMYPYVTESVYTLLKKIKPTNFITFKTEVLSGEFIWVDDQPTAYEIQVLEENGWLDRWYQVNTRKNSDELLSLFPLLEQANRKYNESQN